jgi:hypothetical protein
VTVNCPSQQVRHHDRGEAHPDTIVACRLARSNSSGELAVGEGAARPCRDGASQDVNKAERHADTGRAKPQCQAEFGSKPQPLISARNRSCWTAR